jgi:hypothetical protein
VFIYCIIFTVKSSVCLVCLQLHEVNMPGHMVPISRQMRDSFYFSRWRAIKLYEEKHVRHDRYIWLTRLVSVGRVFKFIANTHSLSLKKPKSLQFTKYMFHSPYHRLNMYIFSLWPYVPTTWIKALPDLSLYTIDDAQVIKKMIDKSD